MTLLFRPAMIVGALLAAGSILSAFAPAHAEPTTTANNQINQAELLFWQSVADSRDPAQFKTYLAAFPSGLFAGLARAKIAWLASAQAQTERTDSPSSITSKSALSPSGLPAPSAVESKAASAFAPIAGAAGLEPAFVEELRTMALSQGRRHLVGATALPARPSMDAVGVFQLPEKFCSAADRNAFHDSHFLPLINLASANNARAIAHMKLLTRLSAEALAKGDISGSNLLAKESASYEPVAKTAYLERSALDPMFPRLMAVPVALCAGAK